MTENHLRSPLARGEFVCSAELVLGRDHTVGEAETFVREASANPGGIRVISLTDLPGGNPALPPEDFVPFVREHGLTPIAHLTGKDANRSLLEGRLHALAAVGAENVLALTGDAQKSAFAGKAKPVYDLDSVLILWLIRAMRDGVQYQLGSRTARTTPFDFFPGAVVNPFKTREPDLMMQLYKLELKIAAGARFVITQLGFNLRKLFELKQYLDREEMGGVPVLANVYVPTPAIARMMRNGELAGCVASEGFVARLEGEKKPQRLERAALMVAAVKDLGFAGAHIGGFGLTHRDFVTILEKAGELAGRWNGRIDELIFESPEEFYLLPAGASGLSDGTAPYRARRSDGHARPAQRLTRFVHDHLIAPETAVGQFLASRVKAEGEAGGFWCRMLAPSSAYREAVLGCQSCGDCIQDHLNYVGCSMRWCYKELRNGPCGGSRMDGSCEARPDLPCIWNAAYESALALGEDPRKFARTLVPPRDWNFDHTNALVNRFAGVDNLAKRVHMPRPVEGEGPKGSGMKD
ncbi:MAG: methylenetetrahydrofolate reductase C-terminal domain-containing protein [Bryobacteraceae bacterium]